MGDVPSLLEFYEAYKAEEACWNQLRESRWGTDGFTCPTCDKDEHWGFIQTRKLFQCHECGKQTSVTAGTILQDTKLDLTTWFLAAYFLVVTKKGVSTPDLAMKVGVSEKTAWFLSHKILEVLGKAPAGKLFGIVEADETFLEGKRSKGGRASNEQMVMGVVERGEDGLGQLQLRHISQASRDQLHGCIQETVHEGSTVRTDGWQPYRAMSKHMHERLPEDPELGPGRQLPAIHIVFSKLKQVIKGVHTHTSEEKLRAFPNVFSYRFNHRDDPVRGVERVLEGFVHVGPVTYDEIHCGGLN